MNIIEFYLKTHKKIIILILGINVPESNHHIYGERLVLDLNNDKNGLKFEYMKILTEQDIDFNKINTMAENGLVITSNVPLERELIDFVIYIDTDLKLLKQRGLEQRLDFEALKEFKSSYKMSRFMNDQNGLQVFAAKPIYENKSYNKLWEIVIDLVEKDVYGKK